MNGRRGGGGTADQSATLQSGLDKVNRMIEWGRRAGYTEAAINLEQWRDARGDREMPASAFENQQFLLDHLRDRHRPRFIDGARRRLRDQTLVPGGTVDMEWTDSVNAPLNSDLWFALGGFTVHSRVRGTVIADPVRGNILRFDRWQVDCSDVYDWDAGKSTWIPGIGRVTDEEMLALERAGHGRSFRVTSEVFQIRDRSIVEEALLR